MSDEVSLFSLMESHLSKTTLNDIPTENIANKPASDTSKMPLPTPSGPKLVIPNFFPGKSPIKDFLAEQISNTLKAKEKRKQEAEEQQKIKEGMQKLKIVEQQFTTLDGLVKIKLHDKEEEYIIDLTSAIIRQPDPNKTEVNAIASDKASTKGQRSKPGQSRRVSEVLLRWDKETCVYKPWIPNLPCTTDISYILKQKVRQGKCSSFGKVICSRLRPIRYISIPHEINKFNSNVVRFDFKTKSPGDIFRIKEKKIKENQRKPKMSVRWTVDITDYI